MALVNIVFLNIEASGLVVNNEPSFKHHVFGQKAKKQSLKPTL